MTQAKSIASGAVRLAIAGMLAALLLPLLVGCGAEAQKVESNPTPTAVPGGATKDDYKAGMQRVLDNQKGNGSGAPPKAPGSPK